MGERRTFQVFDAPGSFTEVEAVARFVGARAALFVDVTAPSGGYTDDDLRYFSDMFDDRIEPVVTGSFGETSDLDGNDRIVGGHHGDDGLQRRRPAHGEVDGVEPPPRDVGPGR